MSMKRGRSRMWNIFSMYINRVAGAFIAAALLLACNLHAATYTVTSSADDGVGTLRDIVANDVVDGDIVEFAAGITSITLTNGRININDSIHIKGPGPENLTIDGNANDRGFYMVNAGVTSIVSGITITNCSATVAGAGIYIGTADTLQLTVSNCVIAGCTTTGNGGGINLGGGKATIVNSTITGCTSASSGGAIYNDTDVNLYMKGCTISGNTASSQGGGLYNNTSFSAEDCVISGNTAANEGGGLRYYVPGTSTNSLINCVISNNTSYTQDGGAIAMYKCHMNISNCVITANSAGDNGGGIFVDAADNEWNTYIWNTTFTANKSHDYGGAIYIDDQNIFIYNSTFTDNATTNTSSVAKGGAIYVTGGESFLFVDSSTFYRNQAAEDGGAIAISDPVELRNCTISGNISADQGGGIYIYSGSAETQKIYNCTIFDNACATDVEGGGIYRGSGTLEIYSSIIASNMPNNDIQGRPAVMNYCLYNIRSTVPDSETGNITGDPQLEALADNGGLTLTHALAKDSIAIDVGSNPLALAYDQRGVGYPREEGTGLPDIGAFEFNAGAPKGTMVILQ